MATESGKAKPATKAGRGAKEKTPAEIEADIEATREELGDTVAELADKTDVKKQARKKVTRTKAKATAKKDEVKEKAAAQKEAATAKAAAAAPDSAQEATQAVQTAAAQAAQTTHQNPIAATAVGAFVGGLAVGWILGRR